MRRSVRAADGAGLENQWTAMSRGFESHGLRQIPGFLPRDFLSFKLGKFWEIFGLIDGQEYSRTCSEV